MNPRQHGISVKLLKLASPVGHVGYLSGCPRQDSVFSQIPVGGKDWYSSTTPTCFVIEGGEDAVAMAPEDGSVGNPAPSPTYAAGEAAAECRARSPPPFRDACTPPAHPGLAQRRTGSHDMGQSRAALVLSWRGCVACLLARHGPRVFAQLASRQWVGIGDIGR